MWRKRFSWKGIRHTTNSQRRKHRPSTPRHWPASSRSIRPPLAHRRPWKRFQTRFASTHLHSSAGQSRRRKSRATVLAPLAGLKMADGDVASSCDPDLDVVITGCIPTTCRCVRVVPVGISLPRCPRDPCGTCRHLRRRRSRGCFLRDARRSKRCDLHLLVPRYHFGPERQRSVDLSTQREALLRHPACSVAGSGRSLVQLLVSSRASRETSG